MISLPPKHYTLSGPDNDKASDWHPGAFPSDEDLNRIEHDDEDDAPYAYIDDLDITIGEMDLG